MRPAEVTPAPVLAGCGSVRREINRKRASPVPLEMCQGSGGVRHSGTGLCGEGGGALDGPTESFFF